ncbi:SpaA isopeptide-forming pilin-related protein [Clostridium sp. UBA6640]|uniref:SpaA isopeptide-forming pilin-related protein n=1 Tax=Clostridium sp. UBA6640 TaxID=1946370 RepID=UPI0025B997E0|nr:SpaA isopeptide-forming pilin-related protein [Clostridium sp. UBA6640]
MKQKKISIIAMVIILFFQLSIIAPAIEIKAVEIANPFQFITGISLTDAKGEPIDSQSNPISRNAEIKLNYTFTIPDGVSVKQDDTYTMQIPKEIQILDEMSFSLNAENGESIGTCTIGTDGKVNIVFNDCPEEHPDISGDFYVQARFNEEQIGDKNPVPITFHLGGSNDSATIEVNFEQPVNPDIPVDKEGIDNPPITPGTNTNEEEPTKVFQFITGISLTDEKGDPIDKDCKPINKNSVVRLNYAFAIPNEVQVKKGDIYTMEIPKEIEILYEMSFSLNDEDGESLGTCTIGTDKKVTIVFTDYAERHSNVSGYFYVETHFDEKEIGDGNPVTITFDLGGTGDPVTIEVNFEQPQTPEASIYKEGYYDASKNEITWKVIINPENVKINNAQIIDDIQEGQEFVANSVKVNGRDAYGANYSYDTGNSKLVYNFPDVINTEQIITFKTKVIDPKVFESEGNRTYQYNKATLNHDGVSIESNEASVEIYTDYIRKNGNYDATTKKINWIIYVNNNAQYILNAVVTDDIPEGLTLTKGSVKLDGVEITNYTMEGQKFTYSFPTAINEPHQITFSTDVTDPGAYNSNNSQQYRNTVTLTGTGVPSNASDSKGVGVPSSIIRKEGVGYNAATGEITWRIIINSNKTAIDNAIVKDEIRLGQEYVEGSAKIDNGADANGFNYIKADQNDKEKAGTLTYKFNKRINDTYTITFRTKVTDPKVFAGNANKDYYNVAILTGDNIPPSNHQGTQRVQSQVINKASADFDYTTREITWRIVVNKNKMILSNAHVIDVISEGQEFVDDSVTINGDNANNENYSYDKKTNTLRYNFPPKIDSQQVITFKTKIKDLSEFATNGEKQYQNTATLIDDLVPGGVESTGTAKIKNTIIGKNANYTLGKSYIDWEVTINSNKILMKDVSITDILQEGLELDTTSVKLYKQILKPDGTLIKGDEVALIENSVKYDFATREFIFTLPNLTSEAYLLTFRTDVTDKSKSPFTNSVSLSGTGITQSSTSLGVVVSFQGSGGGGTGTTGSIKVIKVDGKDSTKKLQGAVFELFDLYQNVIRTSAITGENGEIVFDKLKFDIDYYVREKTPPTGYKLSNELYKFQLKNSNDKKEITYNYKNDKITGVIEFYKIGEEKNPLKGAEFKLYKDTDKNFENPLDMATSDENGCVQFKNIEYGSYNIKETKAPTGYNLSTEIITATIDKDGSTIQGNPYEISNRKIRGSVEFYKVGESGAPLKGAEFKLYNDTDKNFENPLDTATSDENGCVQFKNVEYGSYNIKETKAPTGYNLSTEIITAIIDKDGSTIQGNPYEISNRKIRGSIEFYKVGESGAPLKGAEFKLYNSMDKKFEKPLDTVVSDEKGHVQFKNVEYGDYNIKETKAPSGYSTSTKVITATIHEDGVIVHAEPYKFSNTKIPNNPGNVDDPRIKDDTKIRGTIEFYKAGEHGNMLKGAEFKLYKDSDRDFKNPLDTATSDGSGRVQFRGVEYGDYKIRETKAPAGYSISTQVITATINKDGVTVHASPYTVLNIVIKGRIELYKVGEDGSMLEGAEFKLYKYTDREFENPLDTATSDVKGRVQFNNVDYGSYTVKETKAPKGYSISDKEIFVDVAEYEKTYELGNIKNDKIKSVIKIKKLDQQGRALQGAEFTLYDSKGKAVNTSLSGADGVVLFKDVIYGNYKVIETKAPKGYMASQDKIEVFVDKNGATYAYEFKNSEIRGTIEIKKTDINGNSLQGAEFTLYDKAGKEVAVTVGDKNGIAMFRNVSYGAYTIKETKAPKGYNLNDEILKISIDSTKIQRLVVQNEHEAVFIEDTSNLSRTGDLPQTGGRISNRILMFIGSISILMGIGFIFKRKEN